VAGKFSQTGAMAEVRADQVACLLQNGSVLVAGGDDGGSVSLNTAEIYDPATGQFGPTGSMVEPSPGYESATTLEDGRVLVVEDTYFGAHTATAELYWP
jgi:Kelch motif